jgi:hypothetical protein
MVVSEINITPVKPTDGLVAFASCVVTGSCLLARSAYINGLMARAIA